MLRRQCLFQVFALLLTASCGGDPSGPQSERNAYGKTLQQMKNAPVSVTSNVGTVSLKSWAFEYSYFQPDQMTWMVDPLTGVLRVVSPNSGTSLRTWYVGVTLNDESGNSVSTDWTFQTLWVMRGDDFISSRELTTKDNQLFIGGYPSPPFSRDGTRVVVELTRGTESVLVSDVLKWPTP